MGQLVSAAQAAWLVRKNERAVRWRIAQGALPATHGDDGHMRVALDDLERIPGWRVDPARLDELTRRDPDVAATLEERIATLEARIRALEQANARVAPPQGRQVALPALDVSSHYPLAANGPDEPVSAPSVFPRLRAPVQTVALSSELPDGWVPWRAFATTHDIAAQTVKNAIDDGRLPVRRGRWKVGRVYVEGALDAQGQATFFRLWGGRTDFMRCSDCPHTVVLAESDESVS